MKQQMNFYRPERPAEKPFPLRGALILAGVLAVIGSLALVSYLAYIETQDAERQLVSEEASRDKIVEAKVLLQKRISSQSPDRALARELRQLERDLVWKRKAAISAPQIVGNDAGSGPFSVMLEGLARQLVQGLWLTDISLQQRGREAAFSGGLLRADLLANFIAELQAEKVFEGREFTNVEITRPLLSDLISELQEEESPDELLIEQLEELSELGVKYADEENLAFQVRSALIKESKQ